MQTGIIPFILPIHILAGFLALVFGYVALYAAKGATLHRRSGLLFVCAMVVMSLLGAFISALATSTISVSVIAGVLTFYLVMTALITVSPRARESSRMNAGAALGALAVGMLAFKAAFGLMGSGRPEAAPCVIFGIVALLAGVGDVRVLRAGGIHGPRRIKRHLWRMCFAMWVAAASFFWGPQGRVPEVIRIPALQAGAVLLPIAVMLYWLWRLRSRKTRRGLPGVGVPSATALAASTE